MRTWRDTGDTARAWADSVAGDLVLWWEAGDAMGGGQFAEGGFRFPRTIFWHKQFRCGGLRTRRAADMCRGYGGKTAQPPDVIAQHVGGSKHPPTVGSGEAGDRRLAGPSVRRATFGGGPA